jgi:hypothetical protein
MPEPTPAPSVFRTSTYSGSAGCVSVAVIVSAGGDERG